MSAGAIPVFVVRDWVRPLEEKIDWPSFSFVFSPDDVGPGMVDALRAVGKNQLLEMQVRVLLSDFGHKRARLFGGHCCNLIVFSRRRASVHLLATLLTVPLSLLLLLLVLLSLLSSHQRRK